MEARDFEYGFCYPASNVEHEGGDISNGISDGGIVFYTLSESTFFRSKALHTQGIVKKSSRKRTATGTEQ